MQIYIIWNMSLYNLVKKMNRNIEDDIIQEPWNEMTQFNSHIPWWIFDILFTKWYELFEWSIKQQNDKPSLIYIPNEDAQYTMWQTLKNSQKLLFMVLWNYSYIRWNIIKWNMKSVAFIIDKKTWFITKKTRRFNNNCAFDIQSWWSWALLLRNKI